jgi:hypothetical protein
LVRSSKIIRFAFFVGLLIVTLMLPVNALPQPSDWAKERMTYTSGDSWFVDAEFGPDGTLHFTWLDDSSGTYQVYYNFRTSAGSYGTPFRLISSGVVEDPPRIAVGPDGDVIIVWGENRGGGKSIYCRWRQSDTGWQPEQNYTPSTSNPSYENPSHPDVAINSLDVATIAWHSYISGGGGHTHVLVDGVQVGGSYFWSAAYPRIVFDKNDNLCLVFMALHLTTILGDWNGWEVRSMFRSPNGEWGPEAKLAGGGNQLDGINAMFPDIAVGGSSNTRCFAYLQEGPPISPSPTDTLEVYCRVGSIGGSSVEVDGYGVHDIDCSVRPSVQISSAGTVLAVWSKKYSGQTTIYCAEVNDNVVTDYQRPLTETGIERPIILIDEAISQRIYIIYEDYSLGGNAGELWLIKSPQGTVPEFPSFLVLPLFMVATLLAVIVYRRKRTM